MAKADPKDDFVSPEAGPNASPVERLFREHNEALLRFLRSRLRSDADAREAAQEAYVRLLQLDEPDRPAFLRAYLFKIGANVASDLVRRQRVRTAAADAEPLEPAEPPFQEQGLMARQQLHVIREALDELPPRCREAFLFSRMDGLSTAEIGVRLKVSDRMARLYLVRALEHIQAVLARSEKQSAS